MLMNIPHGSWAVVFVSEPNEHQSLVDNSMDSKAACSWLAQRPCPAAGAPLAESFTERVAVGSL